MEKHDRSWLPLGLSCILIGVAAISIASRYPYGSVTAMGPGFVPTAVAILLVVFGALILVQRGAEIQPEAAPPDDDTRAPAFAGEGPWRPILCVGAAIVLFGLLIEPAGLLPTIFLVVLAAGLAHPEARALPLLVLAASLAVCSAMIFVLFLGLNIGLLPKFG